MNIIDKVLKYAPNLMIIKPGCPSCSRAQELLHDRSYVTMSNTENLELIDAIKEKYAHRTYPMIFLEKRFVGGCDDLEIYLRKKSNL